MSFKTEPLNTVAQVIDSLHKTPKYDENGKYSMVRAVDIQYGNLNIDNTYMVNQSVYNDFSRKYKPAKGDTLIVRVGVSYGRISIVDETNFCLGQNTAAIVPIINKRYIYYVLSSNFIKKQIDSYVVGAAQPTLSLKAINALEIPRFGKSKEQKIAHILSTLDDKIELNRKMNKTLEEMSQTIFKSWFVDFDPVHAKANANSEADLKQIAKEIGISKEVLDLFPDEFEESELGMIPKGWAVKPLYETAEYVNGGAFKEKDFSNDKAGLPIIKIAELKNGISAGTKYTTGSYKPRNLIDNGDVLYSWSGSPETSLDLFKWFGGKGWLNQHIFKLNFLTEDDKYFTCSLLKQIKPLLIRTAQQKQTTGLGHITVADMKRIKISYPDVSILKVFSKYASPLYNQSSYLMQQNQNLQKTRDTLLPKLLSGELDVSELELGVVND